METSKKTLETGKQAQDIFPFPTKFEGSILANVSPPLIEEKEKKRERLFPLLSFTSYKRFLLSLFSKFKKKEKKVDKIKSEKPKEVMRMADIKLNEEHKMVDDAQKPQQAKQEQQITFEQLPLTAQLRMVIEGLEAVLNNQQVIYNEIAGLKAQAQQVNNKPQEQK